MVIPGATFIPESRVIGVHSAWSFTRHAKRKYLQKINKHLPFFAFYQIKFWTVYFEEASI